MNDTDAVIARGLFPLEGGGKSLQILSENVDVTVMKNGIKVRRKYKITNNSKGNNFLIGTICNYNSLNAENCSKVFVNGNLVELEIDTAYLVDKGTYVQIRKKNIDEIAECLKYVDGTVCGHIFGVFEIHLDSGMVKDIELVYVDEIPSRRFPEKIVSNLYLYSEKFWSGDTISNIEIRLNIEDDMIPIDYFLPEGYYKKYSISPDIIEDGVLIWNFTNYNPNKKMYAYTYKIVHPFSIMGKSISEAYEKAIGRKIFLQH